MRRRASGTFHGPRGVSMISTARSDEHHPALTAEEETMRVQRITVAALTLAAVSRPPPARGTRTPPRTRTTPRPPLRPRSRPPPRPGPPAAAAHPAGTPRSPAVDQPPRGAAVTESSPRAPQDGRPRPQRLPQHGRGRPHGRPREHRWRRLLGRRAVPRYVSAGHASRECGHPPVSDAFPGQGDNHSDGAARSSSDRPPSETCSPRGAHS